MCSYLIIDYYELVYYEWVMIVAHKKAFFMGVWLAGGEGGEMFF